MTLKLSVLTGVTGLSLATALGATACVSLGSSPGGGQPSAATSRPSPSVRTIIKTVTVTPSQAAAAPAPAASPPPAAAPAAPVQVPNVTDPWAVVSAYYGDVESHNYAEAYALLSSGMVTGQSYQDFVNGYACTGSETVSENWESGDQVNFSLIADDTCTGATQYFTGTDTVQDGRIVAADVVQTG